jgi:hypothetical protein
MTVSPSQQGSRGQAYIPAYLLGREKMPRSLPEYYSPGDESEAIFYTKENLEAWEITPGALERLLLQTKLNT